MTEVHKDPRKNNKNADIDAKTSERTGIAGLLETALRRFRTGRYIIKAAGRREWRIHTIGPLKMEPG